MSQPDPADFTLTELGEPEPLPQAEQLLGRRLPVEDDEPDYFPPTDPVVIGQTVVGGFSHTSMDSLEVEASTLDGQVGDEALADAVRQELRADAATSTLTIDVTVQNGVAYLRGRVAGFEDVESAEEVAGRLPQLAGVVEQLDVTSDSPELL